MGQGHNILAIQTENSKNIEYKCDLYIHSKSTTFKDFQRPNKI